jgi:spermidine synthase
METGMPANVSNASSPHSRSFIYYLVFTAVICGALVMVIEILGSRVIGPFFGASLFVWTSLITVTLIALAGGYAAGGFLSDKKGSPDYLYGIILLAGVLVLLIPFLKGPVLRTALPLGLRSGAFISSLVLFGPALFLLGCVSPYLIRIAAGEMRNIGRTVGVFYAISTIGSFLGTVMTGFIFIAFFKVNQIFAVIGLLLVCLSAGYFVFWKGKRWVAAFVLLPFLLYQGDAPVSKLRKSGTRVTTVFSSDSFYGNLKVVDYSYEEKHTRELMIDGQIQGGIDMKNRLSVYAYSYFLEALPTSINPEGKDCLVIGLGAGVVPLWYESRGIKTDVVDIDPDVVRIAREFFDFSLRGDVVVSDARYYLNTSTKKYDYIIMDVSNGDTTPGHILSLEALQLVRARMTERGIFAINFIGSLKKENFMTASIIRTLESAFATVNIYPNFSSEAGDGIGNITVLAYNFSFSDADIKSLPAGFSVHPLAYEQVRRVFGKTFRFPQGTKAVVLTDDYNPIDFYDAWLKERLRRGIIDNTDWEVLI